jgi:excisionase family DNA binding protein|nr:MAG TPA: helix-turn-helix domain protein [Caudoviricetes sp.]
MDEKKIFDALSDIKRYTLLAAKEMLTVEDMSLLTGFKPTYIRKMIQEGRLPYYKPSNGKVFFKKSEVNAYLEGQRIPSIAELVNR